MRPINAPNPRDSVEQNYYQGNLTGRSFPHRSSSSSLSALAGPDDYYSHGGDVFQPRSRSISETGSLYRPLYRQTVQEELSRSRMRPMAGRKGPGLGSDELALMKAKELAAEADARESALRDGYTKIGRFTIRGRAEKANDAARQARDSEHARLIAEYTQSGEREITTKDHTMLDDMARRMPDKPETTQRAMRKAVLLAMESQALEKERQVGRTLVSGYKVRGY